MMNQTALIVIKDRGPGIPEDITDALGRRYISRKKGGLGLGVLLSSASIERLGGQVTLLNRPVRGHPPGNSTARFGSDRC